MASVAPFATPAVLKALRQLLFGSRTLTEKLGRGSASPAAAAIYTEGAVPVSVTTGEYLSLGPFNEVPRNTMGSGPKWGRDISGAIKVVSYSSDQAPAYALMTQIINLLDGQALEVDGFRTAWAELDVIPDAYEELVAGVVVRHFPMLFRVHVHES